MFIIHTYTIYIYIYVGRMMDRSDLGLYMYKLDLHKSIQGSLEKKAVVSSIDQGVKIMNSYSGTKSASGVVKHGAGD